MAPVNCRVDWTRRDLPAENRLNFRGNIYIDCDLSEKVIDEGISETNLLRSWLRSRPAADPLFYPINLRSAEFKGVNLLARRNYHMTGSIVDSSKSNALKLNFSTATLNGKEIVNCEAVGKPLRINSVGSIVRVSMSSLSEGGLGPEYSIQLVHNLSGSKSRIYANYTISASIECNIPMSGFLLGRRAWFVGTLSGWCPTSGQAMIAVISGRVLQII
ncbi:hypothetical protein PTTG_29499 [Puccinia triticina 1-1 BBBD Race 1]|uniref:Uncharacterized protein n=1 Tax=Puccinia triticina (isolate 1-1 / race 1 (BBBD)) TaxID=630390 RepID=A0A180G3L9_PUCT1|nr:hypothetical protein PTTG_29499 [Puccinia triticina 1-1 BBBD Race 1]